VEVKAAMIPGPGLSNDVGLPKGFGFPKFCDGDLSSDLRRRPSHGLPKGFGLPLVSVQPGATGIAADVLSSLPNATCGAPIRSFTRKNIRRREARREKKLVSDAMLAMRTNDPNADQLFAQAIKTAIGKRTWPAVAALTERKTQDTAVVKALSTTLDELGSEKGSQFKSPLLGRLIHNCEVKLSPAYLQQQLKVNAVYKRQAVFVHNQKKKKKQKGEPVKDALSQNKYDVSNITGQLRVDKLVQDIIETCFLESTSLDSYAKRSRTRKLLMKKYELQALFYGRYPDFLRERTTPQVIVIVIVYVFVSS
jgi:hypothetical protein